MDSCGESFFFYGLTDFILFLVLVWRYGFFLPEIFFFVFFYPEYLALGSIRHKPCPTNNFSSYLFPLTGRSPHFHFGVPANHLASLFFLPVSGDPSEVPKYKHLVVTVILWRLATVNSNTRIVVIIFQSSQWDTTWHYSIESMNSDTDNIVALNNLQCLIWHKTKSTYKELFLTFEMHTYVKPNCLKWNCFYILLSVTKTIYVCIKIDLALSNLKWLTCYETKRIKIYPNIIKT